VIAADHPTDQVLQAFTPMCCSARVGRLLHVSQDFNLPSNKFQLTIARLELLWPHRVSVLRRGGWMQEDTFAHIESGIA
jgi:hypothetical protein